MKKLTLLLLSASFLLFACNSETKSEKSNSDTTNTSSDNKNDGPWVAVDSAKMMQNMMEYGTPGPMHQMMASWNGTWSGETTMWDHDGAAPQKSTGTAVNTMIMGGKYQSGKHTGNMMGMPFEGWSITGYDNATKQFVSSWIDTWSTGIMNMTGTYDSTSKTLNMTGRVPDIHRPGKECTIREVFKIIDDNTQIMEMYGPDWKTGKEYKMMEIKMTRNK